MKLIIVESHNKIKKIKGFAGSEYEVAASVGHIRDLPVGGGDIGIDREHGHALKYVVSDDKKTVVANLRRLAKAAGAQGVYLATDPDREGETIAFHLCEVLGLDPRTTKRISFQEITEKAIKAALDNPATVDMHLVHAQEGSRAVDRLVGFTLSPVLNRKLAAGLSAGRVQSVAVRLVVERERQIQQFTEQLSEVQAQAIITQRRASAPREVGQHQGKPVVVGQGPKGVYLKWSEQYFNLPDGLTAAAVTPALAINCIVKAQAESAKNVLATVGKYTIGRNEWGLYVTDGEVKAKFKPDCTEEQAKATPAEQAAEMIKSYKAWKKKNAGKK